MRGGEGERERERDSAIKSQYLQTMMVYMHVYGCGFLSGHSNGV